MSVRSGRVALWIVACVLMAGVVSLVSIKRAQAFGGETCSATYQGINQDGQANAVLLDCSPGFATNHDRITVYAGERHMDTARPWQENVNFEDDVWVFDAGALGRASLIVVFHRDGSKLIADLYDDQNGDGEVAYTSSGDLPKVKESRYWTVRAIALNGWWLQGGKINYNLDIQVDGPVLVTFGSDAFVDRLKNDGAIDYLVSVRDVDGDGRPDYELRNAYPPVPSSWGVYRSILISSSREGDEPIEDFIFWPYLGSSRPVQGKWSSVAFYDPGDKAYGIMKDYATSFPPIQVDWSNARINYVGEFVASHGTDKNWYIESINPIRLNSPNEPNFENPFAFYDLAGDQDGYPEMQIRVEYNGANDRFFQNGRFSDPIEIVRYSWDQYNRRKWDFKVDLIGRHAIDTVVQFPDFSVRTVPYDELPYWITGKSWDSVDLVAVEKPDYWSSEGIYESLGATLETRNKYITGLSPTPPEADFAGWPDGFRGEYNLELQRQPFLYLSPVDHKLHLLKAQAGIWNIDGTREVRYDNLSGDYINSWALFENGKQIKSLHVASGYIVYADATAVQLVRADTPPALFTALPPRNHDEWAQLGADLDKYKATFTPDDFAAMSQQFEGPRAWATGATLRDFRLTPEGFRFELELEPGSRWHSELPVAGASDLALVPGAYLVQPLGGSLSIRPLSPPALSIRGNRLDFEPHEITALNPVRVNAVIDNQGLQDVTSLEARFYAEQNGVRQPLTETQLITVPGEGNQAVSTLWTPVGPGVWTIGVEVAAQDENLLPGGVTTASAVSQVSVLPAMRPGWLELLALGGEQPLRGFLVLLLAIGTATAGLAVFLLLMSRVKPQGDEEPDA